MHFGVPASTMHIPLHMVGVQYVSVECTHDCMCEWTEERLLIGLPEAVLTISYPCSCSSE